MKAKTFDKKFDNNKVDIVDGLDLSALKRPNQTQKRVNVDFPIWMIESLDREAGKIGVTRQSIIKAWLAERLEEGAAINSRKRLKDSGPILISLLTCWLKLNRYICGSRTRPLDKSNQDSITEKRAIM
jgi:hypothetical protein